MSKPFIHLMKTINGFYFFDVNKNEIVSIKENVFNALEAVMNSKELSKDDYREMDELQPLLSLGYLSDKRVEEIKHPYSDDIEYFLGRNLEKITLQLTQNCNLRCSYCTYSESNNSKQRKHSPKKMTFDVAKRAVDFLAKHSIDSERVNIGFYGGEPLLRFDLLKQVVEYAKEVLLGKKYSFSITTNGTLLTDEFAEFLIENDFGVTVSLDGPKEIHDKNRRFRGSGEGSFDTILSNLNNLYQKYPTFLSSLLISLVMDPQNDFDTINSLFLENDLLQNTHIISSIIDDTYCENKNFYSSQFVEKHSYEIFLAFLDMSGMVCGLKTLPIAIEHLNKYLKFNGSLVKTLHLPDSAAPGGPCIPGKPRLFVDTDGNFYPCERVSEASQVMKIGNVYIGFDFDKCRRLLNVAQITESSCRDCWVFNGCSLCAKFADDGESLSAPMKASHCQNARNNYEDKLLYQIFLDEKKKCY